MGNEKQSHFYAGHIGVKPLITMVYGILSVGTAKKQSQFKVYPERSQMDHSLVTVKIVRAIPKAWDYETATQGKFEKTEPILCFHTQKSRKNVRYID